MVITSECYGKLLCMENVLFIYDYAHYIVGESNTVNIAGII